ncbi:MAG TPA: chemotaxis protein CheB [Spongiibacteraceae bacterium]|nr:chemotaxis protein CheB [Spongiibacteraceae bacterium]
MNSEPRNNAISDVADDEACALQFPVVAIGASAGGVEALRSFFSAMPADAGAGFVIISHLYPGRASHLAEILGASTALTIAQAEDNEQVRPNRIYVIPPDVYLSIDNGHLRYEQFSQRPNVPKPIDYFLKSLAADCGPLSIAVILTGGDADGSQGLKEIKALGGLVIAQNPDTAMHPSMPENAIATGLVDLVLPVEAMPAALHSYIAHLQKVDESATVGAATDQLDAILKLIQTRVGHDFHYYKKGMLLRRIGRRIGLSGSESLAAYAELLSGKPEELEALSADLLIGVTEFFREPESWAAFQQTVVPHLLDSEQADSGLRIWVPACSTGEEAYTIAMLLLEHFDRDELSGKVTIFATDIDRHALAVGRSGMYPEAIAQTVSAERLSRFFTRKGNQFQVNKALRDMVLFAPQNLVLDPPFSRLDVISCHNLLIYFEPELQQKAIKLFHFSLRPGGHLLLGKSEGVGQQQALFEVVSKKFRIFKSLSHKVRTQVHAPLLRDAFQPNARNGRTNPSYGELIREQLLTRYAPAAVLINRDYQTLYFFGPTEIYLAQRSGELAVDLLAMASAPLRIKLRSALHRAVEEDQPAHTRAEIAQGEQKVHIEITVTPLVEPPSAVGLLLVTFEPGEMQRPELNIQHNDFDESMAVRQLEYELQSTQRELQAAIEELEAGNEELRVVNEEAMSMNEELQSSNEELETSKEEMQSLNEELLSVNSELESKLQQIERINGDLNNLLASTHIPTLFLDRDFCVKRYTPALTSLINLIPTDVGRPIIDIASDIINRDLIDSAKEVLENLAPFESEHRFGASSYYLRRIQPYRSEHDRIDGVVITFTDITNLKRGAEQERRLATLLKDSNDAIIVHDLIGRILSWNRGARHLYGYSEEEAFKLTVADLIPEGARGWYDNLINAARNDSTHIIAGDTKRLGKDGRLIDVQITVSVLQDDDGLIIASTERDISERLAAERELSSRAARLADEDRRKNEFLAMLAHELRNPLAPIRNAVEILKLCEVGEEARKPAIEAREIIDRQLRQLGHLVDDLLDVARITQGRVQLYPERLRLQPLIQQALEANQSLLEARRHRVIVDMPEELVWLEGDSTRLTQVVSNLIENAAKYTDDEGSINIRAEVQSGNLRLSIRDNGVGISPELLPQVFDLFTQGDSTLDRANGGLGIGLRLVQQLVALHNGTIVARSDGLGKGSEFIISLPLGPQRRTWRAEQQTDESTKQMRSLRILVVDDNVDTASSMLQWLELNGHSVQTAANGEIALALAKTFVPEVVFLDIGLPGMNGYELAAHLRQIPEVSNALLVALSGYSDKESRWRSTEAGMDCHLAKPVDPDVIAQLIRLRAGS